MWLIALPPKRPPRQGTYLFDGYLAVPQEVVVEGQKVLGLHVPDTHPTAAATRTLRVPGYRLVEDDAVQHAAPPPPPPPPTQQLQDQRERQAIYVAALTRGWSPDDLHGTWDGSQWTERDERSPRTGLTLLEHAQSRPPRDWAALQAMGRAPWASTDWADPVQGWVPPAWTSPIREVDDDAAPPAPPPAASDDDEPTTVFESSAVDADAATVVDADPSLDGDVVEDVVEYPTEMFERTQEIVARLVGRYGRLIKLGRINAELRKADLQLLTSDAQVDWFLPTT